jgi:hypothetical protein
MSNFARLACPYASITFPATLRPRGLTSRADSGDSPLYRRAALELEKLYGMHWDKG